MSRPSVVSEGRIFIHNSDGKVELDDLSGDSLERKNLAGVADARPALERCRTKLFNILSGKE